jgi:hypothetical protein
VVDTHATPEREFPPVPGLGLAAGPACRIGFSVYVVHIFWAYAYGVYGI